MTDDQDLGRVKLTQAILKTQLDYDPITGIFVWIAVRAGVTTGSVAGSRNTHGYRTIYIMGKCYMSHRLAWLYIYGAWPDDQMDHINGVKDDNRISNLRTVNQFDNAKNQKNREDNTSGCTGVHKHRNKWQARIMADRESVYLGSFDDFNDAVHARKAAELRYGFHENHGRGGIEWMDKYERGKADE